MMGGIDTHMAYPQSCVRFGSAPLFCRFWTLQPHGRGSGSHRRRVEVAREDFRKVGKGDLFFLYQLARVWMFKPSLMG